MYENLRSGGPKVKRSNKANLIEMKKKATPLRILRWKIGNIASLHKDMTL